jgi:hypothetical protein
VCTAVGPVVSSSSDAFDRGGYALAGTAAELRAALEVRQDTPDFKRFALSRGEHLVVVDLVHDRVPQVHPDKPEVDGVRVDPIEEIAANKLTTVVSRMEERDLVDLYVLERAGYRVEDFLGAALAKDGGCTPATLAWLLSEVRIPADTRLPGAITAAELSAWIEQLVPRLRRLAAPAG